MIRTIHIYSTTLVLVLCATVVYAGFQGPHDVLTTAYGKGNGQVGIEVGDSGDVFPFRLAVSISGRIAICDEVNERVIIYKSDGSFERNINLLSTGIAFDGNDALYFKAKFRKYDKNGSMVFEQNIGFDDIFVTIDDKVVGYDKDKKSYFLYSPAGQLITTSTAMPIELGVVNERAISEDRYKIAVTYPDANYELTAAGTFMQYVRDLSRNLYAVNDNAVWRFNKCGKQIAELVIPNQQTESVTSKSGTKTFNLPVKYGQPIIAPNGDVYTWKKGAFKYSVVKWTWVDDPNVPSGPDAPSGLTVTPSTSGLYLNWTASPSDPGCVTSYEISRATSAGGVGSTVGTVTTGKVNYNDSSAAAGTTYYYKVRAVAGSEYSPYTAEVSGKK